MFCQAYDSNGDRRVSLLVLKACGPDDVVFLTRLYKAFVLGDEVQISLGTSNEAGEDKWLSYTPSSEMLEDGAVLRSLETLAEAAGVEYRTGNVATPPAVDVCEPAVVAPAAEKSPAAGGWVNSRAEVVFWVWFIAVAVVACCVTVWYG